MSDEIKDNILSESQWLRILFMALYGLICWVLGIVITALIVGQALFSLVTGGDNKHLRHAGNITTLYFYQILQFLTYCSEDKPFPFAPLPTEGDEPSTDELDSIFVDDDDDVDVEDFSEDSSPETADESAEENVMEEPASSEEPYQESSSLAESEVSEDIIVSPVDESIEDDSSTEAAPEIDNQEDDVFADISFNSPDEDDDDDPEKEKKPENF